MAEQIKVVNLNCPSCGAPLEIHGDMERFACGHCGSEQIVLRRGGTIGLRLVADAVARVQVGTDKTAAELALVRLDKEVGAAQARWQEGRVSSPKPVKLERDNLCDRILGLNLLSRTRRF